MAASGVSVERLDVALQSSCRALGVESLKEHQREAIEYFVKGDDVLVCLPTGYGKSLCFAIVPPLLSFFLTCCVVSRINVLLMFADISWLKVSILRYSGMTTFTNVCWIL